MRMPRITLYVTEALQVEMAEAAEGGPPPNWSRVFARAVRAELDAIATRRMKKGTTVHDIVTRLRASRGAAPTPEDAHQAGRHWASQEAEWDHLGRLANLFGRWKDADWASLEQPGTYTHYRDYSRGGLPFWGPEEIGPSFLHVLRVAGIVSPEDEKSGDRERRRMYEDACSWWQAHGLGERPSQNLVREFVEGAVAVHGEVKDEVEN
jgi:hypothetical protein